MLYRAAGLCGATSPNRQPSLCDHRIHLSFSKVLYKMAGLPPQSPMYSEVSESALSGEDTSQFLVAKKVLCGITVTTILNGIKAFVI